MRSLVTTVCTAASMFSVTSSAVMPEWATRAILQHRQSARKHSVTKHTDHSSSIRSTNVTVSYFLTE